LYTFDAKLGKIKLMKRLLIFIFFIQSLNLFAQSYFLPDTIFVKKVEACIDSIYDYNFDYVDDVYAELNRKYPHHPFPDLFYSTNLYWKYFPITPGSSTELIYLEKLNSAIDKAEQLLEKNEDKAESIFFHLMSRLLIMQYYADNSLSSKVITHLGPAYKMVTKGFELTKDLSDFNFSTGVYNYYREYYPKVHPAYKPFAYFFPNGDAQLGLRQLEYNWRHGTFLHYESLFFLVYINLYFEEDYRKAYRYIKQLEKDFPNNLLYISYNVQTLLLLKKYNKVDDLITKLENNPHENDFFKTTAKLYRGIISEKKDKDFVKAEKYYIQALNQFEKYGDFANSYSSVAYFGLSRIYNTTDKKVARKYQKRALELAVYPHINFN